MPSGPGYDVYTLCDSVYVVWVLHLVLEQPCAVLSFTRTLILVNPEFYFSMATPPFFGFSKALPTPPSSPAATGSSAVGGRAARRASGDTGLGPKPPPRVSPREWNPALTPKPSPFGGGAILGWIGRPSPYLCLSPKGFNPWAYLPPLRKAKEERRHRTPSRQRLSQISPIPFQNSLSKGSGIERSHYERGERIHTRDWVIMSYRYA